MRPFLIQKFPRWIFVMCCFIQSLLLILPPLVLANSEKTKVLYHVDGKDVEVAKYAMA